MIIIIIKTSFWWFDLSTNNNSYEKKWNLFLIRTFDLYVHYFHENLWQTKFEK
jgi:hypothetical protein